MNTPDRIKFYNTRQQAMDELLALHDDTNTTVQYALLSTQRYELSHLFNDHLYTVLNLGNKELRERFLQDIEDVLLDKAHSNADQLCIAYTTDDGTMTKCADINKDLAMINPDLVANLVFVVMCTTPQATTPPTSNT